VFQRVNHFRHARALTRKDHLKRHIQRFCANVGGQNVIRNGYPGLIDKAKTGGGEQMTTGKEQASNAFDIMQQTFILPQEFNNFVTAFSQCQAEVGKDRNFWIMKPVALSRGRGISVINDIGSVSYSEQIVCQKYLMNPLLLDGYKFDLRIYVLATSFSPLEAFVYKEGFARLSSEKFSTNPEHLQNKYVHLTNSSIQKHASGGIKSDNAAKFGGEDGGNKVSLTYLWKRLKAEGIDTDLLWQSTKDVCLKTLVCTDDSIPNQPNAFEVYGFDVIFDDALRPWVIEVNSSPAMARETKLDEQVKEPMIHDTARLVSPPAFDRSELVSVCERRMREIHNKASHRKRIDNKRNNGGGKELEMKSEKDELEKDLSGILMGKIPRQYGELPEVMGGYERLAPAEPSYERIMKLKRKLFKAVPKPN
jgi:tubulin polyglutamylase TTLL5